MLTHSSILSVLVGEQALAHIFFFRIIIPFSRDFRYQLTSVYGNGIEGEWLNNQWD